MNEVSTGLPLRGTRLRVSCCVSVRSGMLRCGADVQLFYYDIHLSVLLEVIKQLLTHIIWVQISSDLQLCLHGIGALAMRSLLVWHCAPLTIAVKIDAIEPEFTVDHLNSHWFIE